MGFHESPHASYALSRPCCLLSSLLSSHFAVPVLFFEPSHHSKMSLSRLSRASSLVAAKATGGVSRRCLGVTDLRRAKACGSRVEADAVIAPLESSSSLVALLDGPKQHHSPTHHHHHEW